MEFSIIHGQGIIKLIFDGFASCLIIRRPVAINWPDCRGSIGQYYAVSELSEAEQINMAEQLNHALIDGTEEEIITGIQDFLQLFENGNYEVFPGIMHFKDSDFHIHRLSPVSKESSLVDRFFSGGFFPFKDFNYILTLEINSMDEERVTYYIDRIRKGDLPKALVFSSLYHADPEMSTSFIIDGHHKIEAYNRLKMDIPAIFIHKQNSSYECTQEVMYAARPLLNDGEFEHLFQNDDENISEIVFTDDEILTAELDRILRSTDRIDLGIINILIRHHQSGSPQDKIWLNKRLEILRTNSNVGLFNYKKNIMTFSRNYTEKYKGYAWFSKTIKHRYELNNWIRETILI
ncbi:MULTISPECIES: hypothetical protein [Chryseobacterium]|uniref:hypothetical protein n=1 Tax=Chryseobacterium TaxID=59732 RepID=UPI001624A062|nr:MULTISPECIES: hypothetical protein [Chryseobacterium]MDM1555959.1 hypothetical protein [Chryseobacterium indologenes]